MSSLVDTIDSSFTRIRTLKFDFLLSCFGDIPTFYSCNDLSDPRRQNVVFYTRVKLVFFVSLFITLSYIINLQIIN